MTKTEAIPQLYAVVCQDLHVVIGLFADLESAILYSKEATVESKKDKSNCLYRPVPFKVINEIQTDTNTEDVNHVGQYL